MKMLLYIALGGVIVLTILAWLGNKSVNHEIMINASPEFVWSVLTKMDKYPEWNPVMELLEGEVKEGNKVKYRFTQDDTNAYEISASVIKVIPNKLLNQEGGIPFVLTYNHKYILEDSGNSTKVIIHEDYRGIGVNFWNPDPVQKAYKRLNEALKERVESIK